MTPLTVAFKTLAMWLIASGVAGMCSALLTWSADVGQYGKEVSAMKVAGSAIFIPIGAIVWIVSDWAASRAFRERTEAIALGLSRADLYAFASVLVGLFLLTDALTQVAYWVVVWRMSRGTAFWSVAASGTTDNTVVYWVAVRAQVGTLAAKGILGVALLFGPERVKAGLSRLRREFTGDVTDREASAEAESVLKREADPSRSEGEK